MKQRPLIGIVAPVLSRHYGRSIIRGALAQAQACGCDCVILAPLIHFTHCNAAHSQGERRIYELIGSDAFDGFLYVKDESTMGESVIAEVEERLVQSNKYVMTVDEVEHAVFDSTQYDDYDDFGKVVRHLIEVHGYRKIYCLTGPEARFQAKTRLRAYQDLMTEHGLYFDETYYSWGTFWVDSAIAYAQRILSGELARPEAVVCGNDVMAMALIKTLQAGGIRVPEEIAVTGYDGFPFSANVDITLTTYARNHYQLGADAVRRLYRNMTGVLGQRIRRPESGFILGSSCGCESIPARQVLARQGNAVPRMWEEDVFCDDMAYDLAAAEDRDDLLRRAMAHRNVLYQADSLRIFLESPEGMRCAAACEGDAVTIGGNAPALPQNDAAAFLRGADTPEAVFLSPLHMHERAFGLIALTFATRERIYDRNYLHFVSDLETGLDRVRQRGTAPAASVRQNGRREQYEKLTELRKQLQEDPGQPWTVERMCQVSGMSRSTLHRHYRGCFGSSVFEDLIRFRVELAKRLLRETGLPLGEIAVRCGYSSESYFMKQFKSVTGVTPTAYRSSRSG